MSLNIIRDLLFVTYQLIKRQSCHHIETIQLIGGENQLTGFQMMATLTFNELKISAYKLGK